MRLFGFNDYAIYDMGDVYVVFQSNSAVGRYTSFEAALGAVGL